MNTKLFLALALTLPMAASCGEATDAADKTAGGLADAAKEMADKAGDALGDFDLSAATPDAIKEVASKSMATITEKLGSIKDLASAEAFTKQYGPMVEKLSAMKKSLGAALPGADALKSALSGLKLDGKVMEMVKPVIDKLTSLVG